MAVIEKSVEEFGRQTSAEEKRKKTAYEEEDQLPLAHFSDSRNDFNTTSSLKPISMVAFLQDKNDTSLSYKHDKAKQCAEERAEEVQKNLDPEFPSFVKIMQPSHVSFGFQIGLPSKFCSSYLPKEDVMMTLVDENQEEFSVKFLAPLTTVASRTTGLMSAGWRVFSNAHKLVEKDVLVFHLIKDTKFQVYIIRSYGLGGIDGVVGSHPKCTSQVFLELKPHTPCQETNISGGRRSSRVSTKTKVWIDYMNPRRYSREKKSDKRRATERAVLLQSNGESGLVNSRKKKSDTRRATERAVLLQSNGESGPLNSRKQKSDKRCATERADLLQSNGASGLNLAMGAMSEVIHIADCIKASNLKTSRDDFMAWDNSLEAFVKLGMNVGSLRARVQRCMEIKAEAASNLKICGELRVEQARVKAELAELERKSKTFDINIKIFEARSKGYEVMFRSVVNSSW